MKTITLFLLVWLITAISQVFFYVQNEPAIFDVRSLIMQLFVAVVIFNSYTILGKDEFKSLLTKGLWTFLFILLSFGVVEFITGIHFTGTTTAKFEHLPASVVYFTPLFLYDNPNDYVLYLLSITSLLILFDSKLRQNSYKILLLLLINYLFMYTSDARLAKLAMYGIAFIFLIKLIIDNKESLTKIKWLPVISVITMSILLLWSKPLFFDVYTKNIPDRFYEFKQVTHDKKDFKINELKEVLTEQEQESFNDYLDSVAATTSSGNVRKNLLLNGINLLKDNPLIGVGPGQFRQRHIEGNVEHPTHTVTNPHNFPIEIISNYGIIGWGYLLIFGYVLLQLFIEAKTIANYRWYLTSYILLTPVFWLIPSSYLYLSIHWITLPLLLILLSEIKPLTLKNEQ